MRNLRKLIAKNVTIFLVMSIAILLARYFGVEEKSWLQQHWETLTAGGLGAAAGAIFFVSVGAIGWVSGPVFGAISLVGLTLGGTLGGLGLRTIVNIIRNPDHYNINYHIVLGIIFVGAAIARSLANSVARKIDAGNA